MAAFQVVGRDLRRKLERMSEVTRSDRRGRGPATQRPRPPSCRSSTTSSAIWRRSTRREKPGQTIQPRRRSSHDAYVRLVGNDAGRDWNSRGHFFAAAARLCAASSSKTPAASRPKNTGRMAAPGTGRRRPGRSGAGRGPSGPRCSARPTGGVRPIQGQLVELRYFAGLTGDRRRRGSRDFQQAPRNRLWVLHRAWLRRELGIAPVF